MDITAFSTALSLFKNAVATVKGVKELIPSESEKKTVSQALEQAKNSFAIAEAEAAKALEYQLCRCQWPPVIMLEKESYHWHCAACGAEKDTTPHIGVVRSPRSRRFDPGAY